MDHCSSSRDLAISRSFRELERPQKRDVGSITVFIPISIGPSSRTRARANIRTHARLPARVPHAIAPARIRARRRVIARETYDLDFSLRNAKRFLSARKTQWSSARASSSDPRLDLAGSSMSPSVVARAIPDRERVTVSARTIYRRRGDFAAASRESVSPPPPLFPLLHLGGYSLRYARRIADATATARSSALEATLSRSSS